MARNQEKAQSMLYRFREQQAQEMGIGSRVRGERRPRMASSVSSLRDCERYRGDIMKEISRKVSKIQDSAMTDYEVRDLNDEINQLMREKRHWETQIVNLGGANYKRGNQAMVDDEGREVPGTRGYKYFGRAKELPGVKELFTRGAVQASEDSARNASFQMFRHQGPEYYGDTDEMDSGLAAEEEELARQGRLSLFSNEVVLMVAEWAATAAQAAELLGLPADADLPSFPSSSKTASQPVPAAVDTPAKGRKSKRKATAGPNDQTAPVSDEAASKKAKTDGEGDVAMADGDAGVSQAHQQQVALAASFLGMLDPESLKMPVLPTTEEMGKILLEVRKKALREQYGV